MAPAVVAALRELQAVPELEEPQVQVAQAPPEVLVAQAVRPETDCLLMAPVLFLCSAHNLTSMKQ